MNWVREWTRLLLSVGHVYSYKGVVLTGVAQTLRPSAAVLEGCAEVTAKWAKKADKGYEAINVDAGRYFSLLAVSVTLYTTSVYECKELV